MLGAAEYVKRFKCQTLVVSLIRHKKHDNFYNLFFFVATAAAAHGRVENQKRQNGKKRKIFFFDKFIFLFFTTRVQVFPSDGWFRVKVWACTEHSLVKKRRALGKTSTFFLAALLAQNRLCGARCSLGKSGASFALGLRWSAFVRLRSGSDMVKWYIGEWAVPVVADATVTAAAG